MSSARQGSQNMESSGETAPGSSFAQSITFDQVFRFEGFGKAQAKPSRDSEAEGEQYVAANPQNRRILPPIQMEQIGFAEKPAKALEPIAERQRQIASTYNVEFVKPGQLVPRFWKIEKGSVPKDQMIVSRQPTMKELDGLEAALKRSVPSQVKADGTAVKVAFLPENSPDGTLASFWAPQSLVMITPGLSNLAATVRGDMRFDQKLMTIEAVLTHEFSHNHEDKLVNSDAMAEAKFGPSAGWIWAKESKTWMLLAKDGSYYGFEGNSIWTKRNEQGQRVDASGKVVESAQSAVSISNDEMQRQAMIRPVTSYFDNPLEMYAEAMMMFRLGSDQRKFLRILSPVLYEIVKENDQSEISSYFGRTAFGNPKYVRDVDGLPKPDSPEVRARIAELER